MKAILLIFLSGLFLTLPIPDNPILEVEVRNIKAGKGVLQVCIFDKAENFFHSPLQCKKLTLEGHRTIQKVYFVNLSPGRYAVVVYQDLNNNGRLDRNRFGIPSEPYGFSNNPSTFFGPPGFDRASFEFVENLKITIRL